MNIDKTLVYKTLAGEQIHQLQIIGWIITKEKQFKGINLGIIDSPQYVNFNATLCEDCTLALINCKIEF